jgi:hypothetical protein
MRLAFRYSINSFRRRRSFAATIARCIIFNAADIFRRARAAEKRLPLRRPPEPNTSPRWV